MRYAFTPRHGKSNRRLLLTLSAEDIRKIGRGYFWRATVTDQKGRVWLAKGAECPCPNCFCDAVATRVKEPHP